MTLEEAIKTAIEYEKKVRDTYLEAAKGTGEATSRKVFEQLGKEEQGHVDYLESKLEQWQKTGHVTPETLDTIVPSRAVIEKGMAKLDKHMSRKDYNNEVTMLRKALDMEIETSNFYKKMVDEMKADGELFSRFLEIEEGHQAIVQAELDYITQSGFMFDFMEFNQEH